MKLLVTGGAGYIGSHVARQLHEARHEVVIADDLSTGHRWAVLDSRLVCVDIADVSKMDELFARERFDAVLHFAGATDAAASVAEPIAYYRANVANTLNLLQLMQQHGVRALIYSSSAAVYGNPAARVIPEETPPRPLSPYGWSKLMAEQMARDAAAASGLRVVILRYFNVAGADPAGRIGQATANATSLIKVACEVAVGLRPALQIFGTDYPTADGTCERDFIHVEDLASAHVAALDYLARGGATVTLNCGYGHCSSVRQVADAVQRVAGTSIVVREAARRPADPISSTADNRRIRAVLDWRPAFDDLDTIIAHALAWERKLAQLRRSSVGS